MDLVPSDAEPPFPHNNPEEASEPALHQVDSAQQVVALASQVALLDIQEAHRTCPTPDPTPNPDIYAGLAESIADHRKPVTEHEGIAKLRAIVNELQGTADFRTTLNQTPNPDINAGLANSVADHRTAFAEIMARLRAIVNELKGTADFPTTFNQTPEPDTYAGLTDAIPDLHTTFTKGLDELRTMYNEGNAELRTMYNEGNAELRTMFTEGMADLRAAFAGLQDAVAAAQEGRVVAPSQNVDVEHLRAEMRRTWQRGEEECRGFFPNEENGVAMDSAARLRTACTDNLAGMADVHSQLAMLEGATQQLDRHVRAVEGRLDEFGDDSWTAT
ncbi:hypothetical protein HDU96_006817 [Phlyctochytrium bullatum]|nr:hypothetical protein HDU96_006817 [Phlyctochytrium bullatum]